MDFNIGVVQPQRPLYPQQPNIPGAVPPAQLHGVGQVMQGMPPVAMLAPYQQDAGARALTLIQQLQSDLRERDNLIAQLHELEGEIQRDQAVVLNVSLGLASYGQQPYFQPQQQQPYFQQHAPQQALPQNPLHAQQQLSQPQAQQLQRPLPPQPQLELQRESLPLDTRNASLPSQLEASSLQEIRSTAGRPGKRNASSEADSERASKLPRTQGGASTSEGAVSGAPAGVQDHDLV